MTATFTRNRGLIWAPECAATTHRIQQQICSSMRGAIVLVAMLAVAAMAVTSTPMRGAELAAFLKYPTHLPETASPGDIFRAWLTNAHEYLSSVVDQSKRALDVEYFAWIPTYLGAIPVTGDSFSFSGRCFSNNNGKATVLGDGSAVLDITFASPTTSGDCEELYAIATVEAVHLISVKKAETHTVEWKGNMTSAQASWIQRNGFRVMRFNGTGEETTAQLLETVSLFFPALLNASIPEGDMERNVNFLANQAYYVMDKRPINVVTLDESLINDGDFFGVIRLDGLDPTLAWAMGAHTGHTTIALRFDGELYICESTTFSNYWPTGGIQRTPYAQWLKQAEAATYNVVHLPLSPESQAKFNSTAAVEWFYTVEGLEYGFENMLFAWIDTAEANYPSTLVSQTHEVLIGWIEDISAGLAMLMWDDAFNMRLGTTGLDTASCYEEAYNQGLTFESLFALPEQDHWKYAKGYSMVCDVLVCETWKAGGIFGNLTDQIQCTEFTNFDAYSLNIFDTNYKRPVECEIADPDSQYAVMVLPYSKSLTFYRFCQIMGPYRMSLPFYNTRPMLPDMADNWYACHGKPAVHS